MKGPPQGFWGKLDQADDGTVLAWHPLADHCADVAACCEALLSETILARRLAVLAGRERLSAVQLARLCVLAALHDIGKFNLGFQNKARPTAWPKAGHLGEVVGLLGGNYAATQKLMDALRSETLATWGIALEPLLVATISHHGRPIGIGRPVNPACWEIQERRDPFAGIADLVARTRVWFPEAWTDAEDPLPEAPAFQHAWCGLVTLADWIGSDEERYFPFSEDAAADHMPCARRQAALACERLGLTAGGARRSLGPEAPGFDRIAPGLPPRAAQAALLALLPAEGSGSVALLEAETGSGKTEAALAYFARLFHAGRVDGLYFALPTRTAATQIYRRVRAAVASLFPEEAARPSVVLAVPGYLEVDGTAGERLAPFRVLWPDEPLRDRGWAAEHPKRYLAGTVAVGTVDQALLSSLAVSHAHLRSTALLRHLLVVDEVHASDAYMARVLEEVLDHQLAAGGHALLLSATLGAAARERLLAPAGRRAGLAIPSLPDVVACAYPLVSFVQAGARREIALPAGPTEKPVQVELAAEMEDPEAVARRALAAARAGARVLVLRNTVSGCVETQLAVEALAAATGEPGLLFRCAGVLAPHHARFAKPDRERLDRAVEAAFGKERPAGGCLAVATQTVEQSLDLDADLLLTDLCPADVLLQRIGRLHRHSDRVRPTGFASARAVVLTPAEPLASRIGKSGEARGRHGLGPVYDDLRALQATWRTLAAQRRLAIPRDNRKLVEAATHPAVLADLARDLGEPWGQHQIYLAGKILAHRRQGTLNVVRRDLPFGTDPAEDNVEFPSGDAARHIPTRLGLADRLVRFAPPVPSLFDPAEGISNLTLPHHLVAPGTPAEAAEAEAVERTAAGLTFRFGAGTYLYDRLGLRIGTASPAPSSR